MSSLIIRAATAADLPFIVRLMAADDVSDHPMDNDSAGHEDGYRKALAAIDDDPHQELLVAERDGRPVGTFQLSYIPGLMRKGMWRGQVENVHVIPEARSEGIGGEMMGWALDRCRARGCGMVQLTSSKLRTDAHRFYQRLGFARSHEGFRLFLDL